LTLALCGLPGYEAKAEPEPEPMSEEVLSVIHVAADVILIRPLRIFSFLAGALLYVPAYALSYADGQASLDEAKEIFFTIPYENAFEKPLGDF
jgi:hypothetical protein